MSHEVMRVKTRAAILAAFTMGLAVASAVADRPRSQNWPHWRGPHADGTAPDADPPLKWDATTNIKWKVPLPGSGSATPIVWGDQVFVATAIPTDRVASAAEMPPPDPRFEVRTDAPKAFHRFDVLAFDRGTGQL